MSRAMQLKEEGNRRFQSGDFVGADSLYSKAILTDPKNPALYTNRAMARLKLGLWDSVVADCNACLALCPSSMKAHYYLSQAQLAICDYDTALDNARRAHELCAATNDRSLAAVTAVVLRCKKERWEDRERKRGREAQDLERELLELLDKHRDEALADEEDEAEAGLIRDESAQKASRLRDVFERARAQSDQRRQVPEWAIDDISFAIMVDPVITKTGKSYERASILEHLRHHPSDPVTRDPLVPSELRPNFGLRQACDEFLELNGWAVDW
ncbi:u-box domain-containing protein [Hirsutella rhossiliensis]|uniref:U-box domain-containing protein n=1 Tax=Hirsutella rhossiliensis TaxID=111463 RepID=A0A9P8N474_9HYPO|nr:u-box domain-containing protein [Hirsutella rhossiliensis]KAH0966535.1 u-box domain-containing protein [Hirsutella rhossiliensis]